MKVHIQQERLEELGFKSHHNKPNVYIKRIGNIYDIDHLANATDENRALWEDTYTTRLEYCTNTKNLSIDKAIGFTELLIKFFKNNLDSPHVIQRTYPHMVLMLDVKNGEIVHGGELTEKYGVVGATHYKMIFQCRQINLAVPMFRQVIKFIENEIGVVVS